MIDIFYRVIKILLKPIFLLLYRPTYIGLENIPKKGAVILAGNHTSNLDGALVPSSSHRLVKMLAKSELFDNFFGNIFFRCAGCIRVDRKNHNDNAKSEALEVLNKGGIIGIFPEGTISKGEILPFKFGAVSFANKTNAYLVPFVIKGKYKLFRKSVIIKFMEPYKVSDDLEKENKKLEKIIKENLNER